ncbi:MAG: MBL fold metallo-hydrolase [bacterium]
MTRQAVSILLTRDPDSTEVYLVKRNPELKFFGGYYAFPGGTLEVDDAELEIKNAARIHKDTSKYLVAAVREVFEETGILLTCSERRISKEILQDYRSRLLADEITFSEILKQEKHIIDAVDFHTICSITTPVFSPTRYETQFYWVKIPEGTTPDIWPGELVHGDFFRAEEAVVLWKNGDMLIVPPVIFMLHELVGSTVKAFTNRIHAIAESYQKGKIHEVYFTPGVQLIALQTRTLFPATHTNTYLIGESQIYIVDPAPFDPTEQQRLWNYLDDLIQQGREFKGILLTHHHPDHVGALEACQKRYGLPVFAHRETAQRLPNIQIERYLRHGDKIDLGPTPDGRSGWVLKVYHTPGHAQDHLAFQENRYGAVIAGDMISTISTIVISPPEGHLTTYLKSLEFLKSITTGTLYPGHGPAVRDGQEVIQYYIEHRKAREEKLLKSLSKEPKSLSDLIPKVYDDVDPQYWPVAEHTLLSGLIKLIEEGRCHKVGDKYQTT